MKAIAAAIDALELPRAEAAKRLGISYGHLGDLISGRRKVTPDLAIDIERELGVPADRLSPVIAAARQPVVTCASASAAR